MESYMSKKIVNEVVEEAVVEDVAVPDDVAAPQITIQIDDIIKACNIIEVAMERSVFKAKELVEVSEVYGKLLQFKEQVIASQPKGE